MRNDCSEIILSRWSGDVEVLWREVSIVLFVFVFVLLLILILLYFNTIKMLTEKLLSCGASSKVP